MIEVVLVKPLGQGEEKEKGAGRVVNSGHHSFAQLHLLLFHHSSQKGIMWWRAVQSQGLRMYPTHQFRTLSKIVSALGLTPLESRWDQASVGIAKCVQLL